jgi:nitrogen fixation/metabolism regulation signal transduction histidine kinase
MEKARGLSRELKEKAMELGGGLFDAGKGVDPLERMLAALPEAVIAVDPSWRVLGMNRAAEELLGIYGDYARGKPFHALDFSIEAEGTDTVLYARGGRFPVILSGSEVQDPGGMPMAHLIVLEDIGRLRELEARRRLMALAEAASRVMREVRGQLFGMEPPMVHISSFRHGGKPHGPWRSTSHKGLMN